MTEQKICLHDCLKLSKWVQCLFRIIKTSWGILAAIPTLLALIELFTFGIGKNSFLLKPILTPRVNCVVLKNGTFIEGNGSNFNLDVILNVPLYLKIVPLSSSMGYKLMLTANTGYSFYETTFPPQEFRTKLRKFYELDQSITKSLETLHRFRRNNNVKFNVKMSGPYEPLENECPFEVSVFY